MVVPTVFAHAHKLDLGLVNLFKLLAGKQTKTEDAQSLLS